MAKRKTTFDPNENAALLVMEATDSKKVKGEDLIGDPRIRKAFKEAKKRAKKAKV